MLVLSKALLSLCLTLLCFLWAQFRRLDAVRGGERRGSYLLSLAGPMSGQMTGQQTFQSLSKIFEQMKPIRTLDGLRSATGYRRGIVAATIPTHQLDFWVRAHPGRRGLFLPIGQEVNDVVTLQIDQDRAEFSPATERKVIYPEF